MNEDNDDIDYDINEAREDYLRRMRGEGFMIVTPLGNELLIDIDNEGQYATFLRGVECLRRNNVFAFQVSEKASSSGLPHRHITVSFSFVLDAWQRIAWQAALGSDPIRELLSCIRHHRHEPDPTMFVERPDGEDLA